MQAILYRTISDCHFDQVPRASISLREDRKDTSHNENADFEHIIRKLGRQKDGGGGSGQPERSNNAMHIELRAYARPGCYQQIATLVWLLKLRGRVMLDCGDKLAGDASN